MLFDVFQQYPAAMPILATVGGLIIGSFLNVVIWRYPIMLRQQMAEFHGEMSSAQSKISWRCRVRTVRIASRLSAFVTTSRCSLVDAQRTLPRLSGENQQALSAGRVIDGTRFFAGESGVARKWMGAGGDDIIRTADCREHH